MKALITYSSKYGSTKQYAEWIAEETGIQIIEKKKISFSELEKNAIVVIGSNIRAGHIIMGKWIKKHWKDLKDLKICLFTVSLTPPGNPAHLQFLENSIGKEILQSIKVVQLHGKIKQDELRGIDKTMMKMGAKMEKDPIVREMMFQDQDHVEKESIKPIVEWIKANQ